MSISNGNHGSENLRRAVRLREEREERWKREGERPLWQNLSMFGSLGWLIVIPALFGVMLGRWIDTRFDTGITFSAAFIFLGVAYGGYLAWKRMHKS